MKNLYFLGCVRMDFSMRQNSCMRIIKISVDPIDLHAGGGQSLTMVVSIGLKKNVTKIVKWLIKLANRTRPPI